MTLPPPYRELIAFLLLLFLLALLGLFAILAELPRTLIARPVAIGEGRLDGRETDRRAAPSLPGARLF